MSRVSNLKFYCADENTLAVVFVIEGIAYYMYSYDCGVSWVGPFEALKVSGTIKSIQILTHKEQFVVAITTMDQGKAALKSCAGRMGQNEKDFTVRECNGASFKGDLIDVTLCVRNKPDGTPETVDIKYSLDNGRICLTCCGHG